MNTNQTTVHICNNILDALYLKNEIQRVTSINVTIDREKNEIKLCVNNSNSRKATVIIQNKLQMLPSLGV